MILKEQKRVSDPVWHNFLQNLWKRYGECRAHPEALIIDYRGEFIPASLQVGIAALITPCHVVRVQWNVARRNTDGPFLSAQQKILRSNGGKWEYGKDIHWKLTEGKETEGAAHWRTFLIRLKSLLAWRSWWRTVEKDLDITNGARGEIVDTILHPDEPPINNCH